MVASLPSKELSEWLDFSMFLSLKSSYYATFPYEKQSNELTESMLTVYLNVLGGENCGIKYFKVLVVRWKPNIYRK